MGDLAGHFPSLGLSVLVWNKGLPSQMVSRALEKSERSMVFMKWGVRKAKIIEEERGKKKERGRGGGSRGGKGKGLEGK